MGIGTRIGRPGKAALLLAVGAAGGGAALAVASVPDSNGVIHGCLTMQTEATPNGVVTVPAQGPNLRIIDPGSSLADQTCSNAAGGPSPLLQTIEWNQSGPRGVPGSTGQTGPPGQPGTTQTVASGHTVTLSGGDVITIAGQTGNTLTITSPPMLPSGKTLTLTLGNTAIAIRGFSFFNTGTAANGGGGGGGKGTVHELTITRDVDSTSPTLALYCANGKHIPKATLTVRKAGERGQYLTYTMTNVLISSYQTGGSGRGKRPTESVSLNFTKIQFKYSSAPR